MADSKARQALADCRKAIADVASGRIKPSHMHREGARAYSCHGGEHCPDNYRRDDLSVSQKQDRFLKAADSGSITTTAGGVRLVWFDRGAIKTREVERFGDMTNSRDRMRVLSAAFDAAEKMRDERG